MGVHLHSYRAAARSAALLLCAAGVLALSGCAGARMSPAEQERAATDTLCEDLGVLRMDAGKLADLGLTTTGLDDVRDLRDDVAHALDTVTQSAQRVRKARADAVTEAYDGLARAVDALPRDTSGAQAAERIRPQLEALDQAIAASQASAKC
ncbi:hypothetical protein ACIRNI_21935 [Streptomyces sp. NPDC093546]|uniref:hypothetical protein n=1 Tax=Streptomyces sp. NPDC093546 TaxID=3366040 RepID=UPI0038128699